MGNGELNWRRSIGVLLFVAIFQLSLTNAAAASMPVHNCMTISSPGVYVLNANIINSSSAGCISIISSNVIFDGAGYVIDGTGPENTPSIYGVYVYNPAAALTNVTVKNLRITDWFYGIYYKNTAGGRIANNLASSNFHGILLSSSGGGTVINNVASANANGIILQSSHHSNSLTNNIANANSRSGINIWSSSNNTVINNVANLNDNGISLVSSSSNIIANNTAARNIGKYAANGNGIRLESSNRNTLNNNVANANSNTGITLYNSSGNTIYNNYFNNTKNAYDAGNNIWNIARIAGTNIIGGPYLGGNYWSDYVGADTNGDGLGDTRIPYKSSERIINGGDYLPLIRY